MARFVVELTYGDTPERRAQVRPAHREYSKALADRGILLVGGPYADDEGAMLVYEVADATELREVLAADPYAEAEVVAETTIREWNPVTGAWVS